MFVILLQTEHEKQLISSSDLKQTADGARTMRYDVEYKNEHTVRLFYVQQICKLHIRLDHKP